MDGPTLQTALYLLAAGLAGAVGGWLLRGASNQREIDRLSRDGQTKLGDIVRQKDELAQESSNMRLTLEAQQALIQKHEAAIIRGRADLESAHEKARLLTKDLFNLREEREGFKTKVATFQRALVALNKQSTDLQSEFIKSGEFYKRELAKAFEKRKALQVEVEDAQRERESLDKLLRESQAEKTSANILPAASQDQLEEMHALEQAVIELEADNAQFKHDAIGRQQEIDALRQNAAEPDELKAQNRELAHCLKSMENSRKQYEEDAKRYREKAGRDEQHSETLALRLDEVEKNFAEIEKQQRRALDEARSAAVKRSSTGHSGLQPTLRQVDDLKDIIGIGKVFEHTLHELGIFSFQQMANLGDADIARVNAELKEFKGRMEQDDWIGQAKQLHRKKYGRVQ